jgi:Family of unknown function (DUF6093)
VAAQVSGIFHPGWVFHHRLTADSGLQARVLIEREVSAGDWNPLTGLQEGAVIEQIYKGPAQIQNVAFPTNRDFVEDAAKFQRMQVTIGFSTNELTPKTFNVQVNDRITVLNNRSDPEKEGSVMYVHGDESSSNAWQRVLTAQTNMKQK